MESFGLLGSGMVRCGMASSGPLRSGVVVRFGGECFGEVRFYANSLITFGLVGLGVDCHG